MSLEKIDSFEFLAVWWWRKTNVTGRWRQKKWVGVLIQQLVSSSSCHLDDNLDDNSLPASINHRCGRSSLEERFNRDSLPPQRTSWFHHKMVSKKLAIEYIYMAQDSFSPRRRVPPGIVPSSRPTTPHPVPLPLSLPSPRARENANPLQIEWSDRARGTRRDSEVARRTGELTWTFPL